MKKTAFENLSISPLQEHMRRGVLDEAARQTAEAALAAVDHVPPFLPTYVIQTLLTRAEMAGLDQGEQFQLADWLSAVMIDALAQSRIEGDAAYVGFRAQPKRKLVELSIVPLAFYRALAEELALLRVNNPEQELSFRLHRVAGCRAEDAARYLGIETIEESVRWHAGAETIEGAIERRNPEWTIETFEDANLREIGPVTEILQSVLKDPSQALASVLQVEDLYDATKKRAVGAVRGTSRDAASLVNESYFRLLSDQLDVPENRTRLENYLSTVLRNVMLTWHAKDGKRRMQEVDAHSVPLAGDADIAEEPGAYSVTELQGTESSQEEDQFGVIMQDAIRELERREPRLFPFYDKLFDPHRRSTQEELAKDFGTSLATLKRRKSEIEDFFERYFSERGLDPGSYFSINRQKRLDRLWDNLRKQNLLPPGATREDLIETLNGMRSQDQIFHVIQKAYLGPLLSSEELAVQLKIAGEQQYTELNKMLREARSALAGKIRETIESRRSGH